MKISNLKFFFAFLAVLAISQICFSQDTESPQAEARLIDEFGLLGCEDIWVRQDAFFVEIQNSPGSVGYAVIYGKKNATQQSLAREKLLTGIIGFRNFYKERLIIIRGKESEEPRTEFWLVPAGADKPDFDEAKWNLTFSKDQKPFAYYASKGDFGVCPGAANLKIYSEYLTENPKARANIVIYEKSQTEFQKQRKYFLDELVEKYKISAKRIRFFFVKEKTDYKSYELWLLP